MTTVAYLDVQRPEMLEIPIYHSNKAKDIHSDRQGHNLVYQWPKTGSWTLYPVNFSSDYVATNAWEACKLRLSDFTYNSDYWVEAPEGNRGDLGKWDFFYHIAVKNSNLPDGYPYSNTSSGGLVQAGNGFVLSNLTDVINLGINIALDNLETDNSVVALVSNVAYPINQGFELRFHIDGRQSYKRTAILDFLFGEYLLRLHTNGQADLQSTGDGINYLSVLSFQWTDAQFVHGRHHSIMIFPHARQHIEILSKIQYTDWKDVVYDDVFNGGRSATLYGGLYVVPGQPVPDPTTGIYPITKSQQIAVRVHREFRPYLQIGRLCFSNGSPTSSTGPAYLYDSPFPLEFQPTINFTSNVDIDQNGCTGSWNIVDVNTQTYWVPGPDASNQIAFYIQLQGIGDIAGPGLASSVTPEFYAYAVQKPPLFQVTPRNTQSFYPMTTTIDFGDDPEAEKCNLTFDNSFGDNTNARAGQVEAFVQRGDIPLSVVNNYTVGNQSYQTVWFEGRSNRVKSREHLPRQLSIEAQGLIEPFLRKTWSIHVPDFGMDPDDMQMRGMYWSEAVYRMFEAGGVPRTSVVIENIQNYDFRLWAESGGGSRGAASGSANHLPGSGTRFRPTPGKPIVESLKWLLHNFLGWTFARDRANGIWRVFKRPHPFVAAEYAAMAPKCAFYCNKTTASQAPDGIFSRFHDQLEIETIKPKFSSIVLANGLVETGYGSNNSAPPSGTTPTAVDPSQSQENRQIIVSATNTNCYGDWANPNPPTGTGFINPDWLGEVRFGVAQMSLPNRECMEWRLRMAYYALCFGQEAATFTADWGDPITAYLRKWDIIILDTGPNYESEWWFIDRITPDITSDFNVRAHYRVNKFRGVCPPPY